MQDAADVPDVLGGEITQAKTRHDEGMKLSPMKIGENYTLRGDVLRVMENFISRAPRMQVTDVKARVAGDQLIIDFEGTSPEHEGSYNTFAHIIAGCARG